MIFGTGVGPADLAKASISGGLFATTAGNTRVLFDGIPSPVLYRQIMEQIEHLKPQREQEEQQSQNSSGGDKHGAVPHWYQA